jgi:hypothetical protein
VFIVARFSVSSDQCEWITLRAPAARRSTPGLLQETLFAASPLKPRSQSAGPHRCSRRCGPCSARWPGGSPGGRATAAQSGRSRSVRAGRIAAAILDPATCRSLRTSSTAMLSGSGTTTAPAEVSDRWTALDGAPSRVSDPVSAPRSGTASASDRVSDRATNAGQGTVQGVQPGVHSPSQDL